VKKAVCAEQGSLGLTLLPGDKGERGESKYLYKKHQEEGGKKA